MERLKERLLVAGRAVQTLREVFNEPKSQIVRDAAIQRFEYSFETVWRAAQLYLRKEHELHFNSPKSVMRGSGQVELLDAGQVELALNMAIDRNLTVHTYNEALAEEIWSRLPAYTKLLEDWLKAMRDAAGNV